MSRSLALFNVGDGPNDRVLTRLLSGFFYVRSGRSLNIVSDPFAFHIITNNHAIVLRVCGRAGALLRRFVQCEFVVEAKQTTKKDLLQTKQLVFFGQVSLNARQTPKNK